MFEQVDIVRQRCHAFVALPVKFSFLSYITTLLVYIRAPEAPFHGMADSIMYISHGDPNVTIINGRPPECEQDVESMGLERIEY